jgi:hypothetical protein
MHTLPTTGSVPVFDCHVLIRRRTEPGGKLFARCAAAPSVTAEGTTEREVLQSIVIRFKYFVQEHLGQQQPIPWTVPELTPEPGEVERWIPVHL